MRISQQDISKNVSVAEHARQAAPWAAHYWLKCSVLLVPLDGEPTSACPSVAERDMNAKSSCCACKLVNPSCSVGLKGPETYFCHTWILSMDTNRGYGVGTGHEIAGTARAAETLSLLPTWAPLQVAAGAGEGQCRPSMNPILVIGWRQGRIGLRQTCVFSSEQGTAHLHLRPQSPAVQGALTESKTKL